MIPAKTSILGLESDRVLKGDRKDEEPVQRRADRSFSSGRWNGHGDHVGEILGFLNDFSNSSHVQTH